MPPQIRDSPTEARRQAVPIVVEGRGDEAAGERRANLMFLGIVIREAVATVSVNPIVITNANLDIFMTFSSSCVDCRK